MANPNRQSKPDTARSEQNIQNRSFDEEFQVLVSELLGYHESSNSLKKISVDENGKLNVNAEIDTSVISTSAKQDSILTELQKKTESTDNQQVELIPIFRALLQAILYPGWLDRSANQIRTTTVVTSATLAANQDLRTVTNLTNVGSFSGNILQRSSNITAWATNVRSLIT